ncbi:MAG: class I SAM-dependent methyltransferase [Opitutaceae bacterium]
MPNPQNFDRLAGFYRLLEYLAFGRDLERARWSLLDRLAGRRRILILGEGDGRCLARLVRIAPDAEIDCVEASGAMIARARARLAAEALGRVRFHQRDALTFEFPDAAYDAVVTLFFLDCFTAGTVADLVKRVDRSLRPGSRWLFADFVMPAAGLARWRAQIWLRILYSFFRWQTGIPARRLPPSEALIEAAGFRREETLEYQWGLLRAALYCGRAPG